MTRFMIIDVYFCSFPLTNISKSNIDQIKKLFVRNELSWFSRNKQMRTIIVSQLAELISDRSLLYNIFRLFAELVEN